MWATPTHAAQPGEEVVNSSGTLTASQTITIPLYSPGASNIRLLVSGGAATDTVTMTLLNGSTSAGTWVARSGETLWGYATFPSGGSLTLKNNSSTTLSYTLNAYARGVVPNITESGATWSGVARGAGSQSSIQLSVPTSGRYRFTLGGSGGSYQIKVDSSYILKTAVPGSLPSSSDSVYYLSAGIHTFTITQNTADTLITWSVTLASADSLDTLPSSESSAVLGLAFKEEWIPIQVASAQSVNIRAAVTGAAADSISFELYNGSTKVYTSTSIFGGEVIWGNSALVAGANRLHVVASNSNSASLAYTITLSAVSSPSFTWGGTTYGNTSRASQGNSAVKLSFSSSGLYTFALSASSGRYQFMLDSQQIQKVVTDTASTNFTAYVASGVHTLMVKQDPAKTSTVWSVQISATSSTSDKLPFTRAGGTLGGTSNAFSEEWLPLQISAKAPVNLKVVAVGATADSLKVELYNGTTLAYSAAKVYGGETFWANTSVVTGTNRLHISTTSANTGQMSYQVMVSGISTIPSSWSGVSLSGGLNSVVQLNAAKDGTYDVVLTLSEGAGQVLVDSTASLSALSPIKLAGSSTTLRVPLSAGLHTFKLKQDTTIARTSWQIAVSLRENTVPLGITSVSPNKITTGTQTTVTIVGQGFENGTTVQLRDSSGSVKTTSSIIVSSTQILLTVPSTTPAGVYSLLLTNLDNSTLTKSSVITIGNVKLSTYIPLVRR